jgi:hypothetical protein
MRWGEPPTEGIENFPDKHTFFLLDRLGIPKG